MKSKDTRRTQRLWDGNTPALTPASDLPSRHTENESAKLKELRSECDRLIHRVMFLERLLKKYKAKGHAKYLAKQLAPKEESKSVAYRLKAGPR